MPVGGAIKLVQEYGEELSWFIEEFILEIEKERIINQLSKADLLGVIQGVGHKKGNLLFTKWRREKISKLDEINDELNYDKLTVFERLVKSKKPKTIFDRLIKYSKRK